MEKALLDNLRHSCAHLLAAAVMELWPKSRPTLGPPIEDGFYYDFDFSAQGGPPPSPGFGRAGASGGNDTPTEKDFSRIEEKMRALLPAWTGFSHAIVSPDQARESFAGNPYKQELIDEIVMKSEPITLYTCGGFTDLCRGGHSERPNEELKHFKLLSVAGAYWRGSEKNKMLTRIYGTCFSTAVELEAHLTMLEEAKKRDHRKLGKELKLFTFSDYVGPGLPLWLPNGTVIIEELEKLARETERDAGYQQVRTPHIAREQMYQTSGHLPYYADSMFPPMVMKEEHGEEIYYLRAMNCPHHHQIYAADKRSYRDLPLRLAEYGTVYRYEKSGELFGLMRVRMLSMNDAHIYCTPEQFASEFKAVNEMYLRYFKLFGFNKYAMRFSTHDPKELGKKYINNAELWKKTEDMVRRVLTESGINYVEAPNEAAFYGPKIDVQVWSSIGREFTIATNQVDFSVPGRFGLTYTDTDATEKTPLVIHRAPLGTHERFIGFLIEHHAGAFPVWLSPVQVQLAPVAERHVAGANKLAEELEAAGIRAAVDDATETVGNKGRKAAAQKIPYIIVVGDKELGGEDLMIRIRGQEKPEKMGKPVFLDRVRKEIQNRSL